MTSSSCAPFTLTQGYADFRVVSAVAELTPDKEDFIITYVVEEGDRYKFGDVKVDSQLRDFDSDAMTERLSIHSGDWYDAKKIEDTVEQMTDLAGTFGYAFAEVQPEFKRNPEDLTMDVTFVMREAPRVYVERIDVNGNTLTQDKVVRREFRVAEGDAFNSLAIKRSAARIKSLGYFQENFEITQSQGSAPDRVVLEANVEEQATGELQLSAGFSSIESFILAGSIRQRNFRGRGQTVGLSLNYSRYSKSANISFAEPYLFDRNISMGADIYHREYDNSFYTSDSYSYSQSTTGGSIRLGTPLSEYMSLIASYTLNFDDVTVGDSYYADYNGDGVAECIGSRFLCEAIGKRTSSIFGLTLNYDTLDSRLRPTRGMNVQMSAEIAGLGGDVKYARWRSKLGKYWNLGSDFIFSLTAEGGWIKALESRDEPGLDDVRLTDRFFLGEPQFRGFDIRGVGPRVVRLNYITDTDTGETRLQTLEEVRENNNRQYDTALGGRGYYLGRAEIEIPLGSGVREMGIRPSVFLDVGSLFGVKTPVLDDYPDGIQRRLNGELLYEKPIVNDDGDVTGLEYVTDATAPDGTAYAPAIISGTAYKEVFYGDSKSPRITVGVGVNWNSPFGPFRIDLTHVLKKQEGDDNKTISFNVGTQF